ncbi:MAG: hypothetical protein OHK93_005290 [Ramalina farinacea]|uniref:Uncharacterized protein n=1 Tax=Ramalina farinacea TaxID=258253 RepID=A0AA43U164_9LECA|nr:hypothetical protein [Ramalina farinacea]
MAISNCRTAVDQKQHYSKHQPASDLNVETIRSENERGFLDLPLEIRMMVYELFFGAQTFRLRLPGIDSSDPADGAVFLQAKARQKVSLLLANREICVEASSFFHRLHLFRIRLLNTWQFRLVPHYRLSVGIQQTLEVIKHVELKYQNPDLDSAEDYNVSTYLRFLRLGCPALKSLRIEFAQYICFSNSEKESVVELQQLWPRLDSLEVWVEHLDELEEMPQGDFIAPGEEWHWVMSVSAFVDPAHQGRRRKLKKTMCCVKRHQKANRMV